ncbi:MAG: hypothetical protein LAN64_16660 [Acidobacteriia bacterium]|nr:hypothetical protein [Terriglobia bacterium]
MRRWLREFEGAYDQFEYNVRIGPSRDLGPGYPDYVRKTAMMSSQLRLDAIAWNGTQATLVELKQKAWALGVQQLALYGAVWAAENPQLPKPKLLLVCARTEVGVMETAAAAGVTVHVVTGA